MINYFGSKKVIGKELNEYFNKIPHDVFFDPFGGGGSIILTKDPSPLEYWNDLYHPSVYFYYSIKSHFLELLNKIEELMNIPGYEISLFQILSKSSDLIEIGAAFFLYSEICFNGNAGCDNNVGISKDSKGFPKKPDLSKLDFIHQRFQGVEISCMDFKQLISKYHNPKIKSLMYLDVPYKPSARKSKDDKGGIKMPRRRYKHDWNDCTQHFRFLKYIRNLSLESKTPMIISGYDDNLYNSYLENWQQIKLKNQEVIWVNEYANL